MKVYGRQQIVDVLDLSKAADMVEQGFIAFSQGRVKVPSVQNFVFPQVNGDCCIKSAYIEGEATFTVKISTGFYDNPAQGLESNDGLMLVLSAQTGQPLALLQDEGWLTCIRTALAGQIAARVLAPSRVEAIGIVGTGMQARLQLEHLLPVTECRRVIVWGRSQRAVDDFARFAGTMGFSIETTLNLQHLASQANLIVTTTPSREALLRSEWIRPGTHITAVGADILGKQELEAELVARADLIVVDSIAQCSHYGEVSHAYKAGLIDKEQMIELGTLLAQKQSGRQNDTQITLADLTGVAVQDAQIAGCALACCDAV